MATFDDFYAFHRMLVNPLTALRCWKALDGLLMFGPMIKPDDERLEEKFYPATGVSRFEFDNTWTRKFVYGCGLKDNSNKWRLRKGLTRRDKKGFRSIFGRTLLREELELIQT